MKQRNQKRYEASFKARVALEALQDNESLAQLGHRHGIHPVLVGQWKKQLKPILDSDRPSTPAK